MPKINKLKEKIIQKMMLEKNMARPEAERYFESLNLSDYQLKSLAGGRRNLDIRPMENQKS